MLESNIMPLEIESQSNTKFDYTSANKEMTLNYNTLNYAIFLSYPIVFLILIIIAFKALLSDINFVIILVFIILLLADFGSIILICWFIPKKVVLRKDESNNTLQITKINTYNHSTFNLVLNIKEIILDIIKLIGQKRKRKDYKYLSKYLIIVNTFKNIDFDKINTSNVPETFYYLFGDIKDENENLKLKISEFIGSSPETENPLFFNIDRFMGKAFDNNLPFTFGDYHFSRYIKFNEKFFSFYLNKRGFSYSTFFSVLFAANFFMGIGLAILIALKVTIGMIIAPIVIIIVNILFFIFFSKAIKEVRRIDIIYSDDFGRMFIGLVNQKEKKYLNTFTLNTNSIGNFTLESINNSESKFNLKVIYKNNETLNICRINEQRNILDGLLYILNKQIK